MEGRIIKLAKAYKKRFYINGHDIGGKFSMDDLEETIIHAEQMEGERHYHMLCEAIATALKAGFMIGYRKAEQDNRKIIRIRKTIKRNRRTSGHKKEDCSRQQNELQPHRTAQTAQKGSKCDD